MKTQIIYSAFLACFVLLFWSCEKNTPQETTPTSTENKTVSEEQNHTSFSDEQIKKLGLELTKSSLKSIPKVIEDEMLEKCKQMQKNDPRCPFYRGWH